METLPKLWRLYPSYGDFTQVMETLPAVKHMIYLLS